MIYFLTVLNPRKSRIKVPANSVSRRFSSWLPDSHLLAVFSQNPESKLWCLVPLLNGTSLVGLGFYHLFRGATTKYSHTWDEGFNI